jgi:hypothetical protein
MLLLIIGLHFVLASIWLVNNQQSLLGVLLFVIGIVCTHFGWKAFYKSKKDQQDS